METNYRETLDDNYGNIRICGYTYPASDALERVDPTAFRCGLSDYIGTGDWHEVFQGRAFLGYLSDDDYEELCNEEDEEE
jgi:hypothetical protein